MVHRDDPSLPSDADPEATDVVGGTGDGGGTGGTEEPGEAAEADLADETEPVDDTDLADETDLGDESRTADEPVPIEQPAVLRRHVKMRTFLLLGLLVGLVLSVGLTFGIPDDPAFSPANPELQFSDLQVFAFLLVFICPLTLGLGGLIGYIVGNVAGRRSRAVVLQREHDEPAIDEPAIDEPAIDGPEAPDEPRA
ncbi:hypothetical protein F8O01_00845 [Pseudoclavibacter chungangensis]|uniref:Uncharacterized protein n=1 Tax=Pseudoclavibacter chungangensis TaxID=587635 RepID=A0A7J5C1M7_9MICO|nr:hypothetical protein [Pseudoclavibacter chungangensis]KAB1662528.1 hypothetical protein F8O01_00845 [Pseudoclavibacter chungangensis]NYJ68567.1 nitrate reductase NapE component [Pseudoclavibacter chungangensis]